MNLQTIPAIGLPQPEARRLRLGRPNWKLAVGLTLILGMLLIGLVAPLWVPRSGLRVGAAMINLPPSAEHWLGTEAGGRDLLAMMIYGTPISLEIGLIAGAVGTVVGTILGIVSGYYRGPLDNIVRGAADVALGIPSLAVLVVIASLMGVTTIEVMALVIALFSWPVPTRTIRSQTLTLREQGFVSMSKLSGRSDLQIMFLEIAPNLLTYIMAGFVGAVSGGILTSVGLQLLGLGQFTTPTLALILETAFETGALLRGLWWWWAPPTIALALLFFGLFLISMALDELANPRLRGTIS